jgi:hypothetical protein
MGTQATTLSEEHEHELRKIFDDYDQVRVFLHRAIALPAFGSVD